MSINAGLIDRVEAKHDVLQEYFDLIADKARVPVHIVGADFKITKVNQRWLDKLGYDSSEVVGRSPTDFLSGESRARALGDVLPLFRRVGSDRSVGMNFVARDGRVVPLLLDAEACMTGDEGCSAFAVLRDPNDIAQYDEASATMEALCGIAVIQSDAKKALVARESSTDANGDDGGGLLVETLGAMQSLGLVPHDLTTREREVLEGLASGARNKEIAAELGTSVRTVKFHVENIFQKLRVHTRARATKVAIELGFAPRE